MSAASFIGTDRLLLGSDYPHVIVDLPRSVSNIHELDIPKMEKENILKKCGKSIERRIVLISLSKPVEFR